MAGSELLLNFKTLIFLIVGLAVGFIVGSLPGFQSSNAVAIVLPLTIGMSIENALIFMATIYAGSQFAGSIPAILINAPGTTGAAATALDGYPMSQQGKGGLAIGIARMASVVGGLIGCFITLAVIGPMSTLALKFGTAELFLVALFGLTLISAVVGTDKIKGLISAGMGLLIAAMGADHYMGQARFNLGFIELYDGVKFVPILIGLFALTEMFYLSRKNKMYEEKMQSKESVKDVLDGIKTTLKKPVDLLRASFLGTLIGAIPGTGTSIANFISYGIAKQSSRDKDGFGKGKPEGVIASEACDSAVTSGTMVPTLTLGIPGSTTAAIMLAALYLHGIKPGPQVMVSQAPEAYAVLLSLGIASILILPLGILLAAPMIAVTRVQPSVLVPIILLLCTLGAFAISNSMFDVRMMFLFGFIGILMRVNNFPVIPLVLGLILGPIAEENFVRAYMLSKGDFSYFFRSPITWILWMIIFLSLFADTIKRIVFRTAKKNDQTLNK